MAKMAKRKRRCRKAGRFYAALWDCSLCGVVHWCLNRNWSRVLSGQIVGSNLFKPMKSLLEKRLQAFRMKDLEFLEQGLSRVGDSLD